MPESAQGCICVKDMLCTCLLVHLQQCLQCLKSWDVPGRESRCGLVRIEGLPLAECFRALQCTAGHSSMPVERLDLGLPTTCCVGLQEIQEGCSMEPSLCNSACLWGSLLMHLYQSTGCPGTLAPAALTSNACLPASCPSQVPNSVHCRSLKAAPGLNRTQCPASDLVSMS